MGWCVCVCGGPVVGLVFVCVCVCVLGCRICIFGVAAMGLARVCLSVVCVYACVCVCARACACSELAGWDWLCVALKGLSVAGRALGSARGLSH